MQLKIKNINKIQIVSHAKLSSRESRAKIRSVYNFSVIRQKDESETKCYMKTKHAKFSEKQTFITPIRTHACEYQGVTNVLFLENLASFGNGIEIIEITETLLQNKVNCVMQ